MLLRRNKIQSRLEIEEMREEKERRLRGGGRKKLEQRNQRVTEKMKRHGGKEKIGSQRREELYDIKHKIK